MTALNPDRQIFFVLCDYGARGLEWAARDPANMSRKETLIDIRSGELPNVVQVIELNVAEFSSRDVTEDILAECLKANFIDLGERLFAQEIAETDHARDHRKNWEPV
jgi:hypothetical protein